MARANRRIDSADIADSELSVHAIARGDVDQWLRWARDANVRGDLETDELEGSIEHVLRGRGSGADGIGGRMPGDQWAAQHA